MNWKFYPFRFYLCHFYQVSEKNELKANFALLQLSKKFEVSEKNELKESCMNLYTLLVSSVSEKNELKDYASPRPTSIGFLGIRKEWIESKR